VQVGRQSAVADDSTSYGTEENKEMETRREEKSNERRRIEMN